MNTLITRINKDEDWGVEMLFKFFEGKYEKDTIRQLLFGMEQYGTLNVRKGVAKLAKEFNELQVKNNAEIRNWYSTTDFYVFDLWPWNGCSMFEEKVVAIGDQLTHFKPTSIVDFGGGLGVGCLFYQEKFPDAKIIYVDLPDSITMKFAKFFVKEMNVPNIEFMSDQEFFDSNKVVSAVVSADCFEHIVNLEETMFKIAEHTNVLIHESAFMTEDVSPQHVQTKGVPWFIDLMTTMNFLPVRTLNTLVRHRMVFDISKGVSIVPAV